MGSGSSRKAAEAKPAPPPVHATVALHVHAVNEQSALDASCLSIKAQDELKHVLYAVGRTHSHAHALSIIDIGSCEVLSEIDLGDNEPYDIALKPTSQELQRLEDDGLEQRPLLVLASEKGLFTVDTVGMAIGDMIDPSPQYCSVFSRSGSGLVTGGKGTITSYACSGDNSLTRRAHDDQHLVRIVGLSVSVSASDDEMLIATLGGNSAFIYTLPHLTIHRRFYPTAGASASLYYSPTRIATATPDMTTLSIWDSESKMKEPITRVPCPTNTTALALAPSRSTYAAGMVDGSIMTLDTQSDGAMVKYFNCEHPVNAIVYSSDDRLVIALEHNGILIIDLKTGDKIQTLDGKCNTKAMALGHTSKRG